MLRMLYVLLVAAGLGGCVRGGFPEQTPPTDASADSPTRFDIATTDAPVADLASSDTGTGPAGETLSFLWATANSLAFSWTAAAPPPTGARLCYAPSTGAQPPSCLTGADDPRLLAPESDRINVSMIYGLDPSTSYTVSFEAVSGSTHYELGPLTASTQSAPAQEVVLYSDEKPQGSWLLGWEITDTNPRSGQKSLEAAIVDNAHHNLHLGSLTLDFPAVSAARVAQGYLEFAVDSPTTSWVCVYLQSPTDFALYCPEDGYVTVDGAPGFQQIQVPLHQLIWKKTAKGIDATTLPAVNKVMIGANWGPGAVYVDDISIWY